MKLVLLSFYYPPDLSAGSFRTKSLVEALSSYEDLNITVITTFPNRYTSYSACAPSFEECKSVKVNRIRIPKFSGGLVGQALGFGVYAFKALKISYSESPDLVFATTGRMMTGVLSAIISKLTKAKLFLDIRDIFPESISDVFSKKSKLLGLVIKKTFQVLERFMILSSTGVNIVSEGFRPYFSERGFNTENWSVCTNGIDKEFCMLKNTDYSKEKHRYRKSIITYAGNIGHGQGLENILPQVAKNLEDIAIFRIIGDGNTRGALEDKIKKSGVINIELIEPVGRESLLRYYGETDALFLQLNDYKAFERVIPSKLFEYGALGKPIIAGLSGYPKSFAINNVPGVEIFNINDANSAVTAIKTALQSSTVSVESTKNFIDKFSRDKIMSRLACEILGDKMGRIAKLENESTAA